MLLLLRTRLDRIVSIETTRVLLIFRLCHPNIRCRPWSTIELASFVFGLILAFIYPEFSDSGFGMGATVIMSVLTSGFCGLMVAIPLMVSNNGLDDSSLFPSKAQ